jgi:hypothetical protein
VEGNVIDSAAIRILMMTLAGAWLAGDRPAQAATQAGQLSDAAAVALKNISGALERCEIEGTAALANAQTIVDQGTTLGLSGGSSNYTPPQTATAGGPGA